MANQGNINYSIADAGSVYLKSNGTSNIQLYSPYANSMNVAFTSSQLFSMANGSRAVMFQFGREGEISLEFEVFEMKFLPILLGGTDWAAGVTDLFVRKEFTIAATYDLIDSPLADSLSIFKLSADNVGHKSEVTEGTPASNPDEYSITGSTVTFNAGDVGEKAVAYYLKASDATALSYSVPVSLFPESFTLDCVSSLRSKYNGVDEEIQIHANNVRPVSEVTLNFSETEVTTLSFNGILLPDENDQMITFIRP